MFCNHHHTSSNWSATILFFLCLPNWTKNINNWTKNLENSKRGYIYFLRKLYSLFHKTLPQYIQITNALHFGKVLCNGHYIYMEQNYKLYVTVNLLDIIASSSIFSHLIPVDFIRGLANWRVPIKGWRSNFIM